MLLLFVANGNRNRKLQLAEMQRTAPMDTSITLLLHLRFRDTTDTGLERLQGSSSIRHGSYRHEIPTIWLPKQDLNNDING